MSGRREGWKHEIYRPSSGCRKCFASKVVVYAKHAPLRVHRGPTRCQRPNFRSAESARRLLDLAYEAHGPSNGEAIVLLHGFPYDPRCYDLMAPSLAAEGYRVIVPYLRGYGPTRFLSAATMRSGQQAALARDLLDLLDALSIERAALVGYDWGGRAACIVAALVAGAGALPRLGRGLQPPGHRRFRHAAVAGDGASLLVSILFPLAARPRRAGREPLRVRPSAVAAVVAVLALRRGDLCAPGGIVRQSGFRRCRRPLLSPSLRLCAGRPGPRGDRAGAREAAGDRRADDLALRRR